MKIEFVKYQGTGNDFILIDNRNSLFPKEDPNLIRNLTNRKFGIGGDGLILIENDLTLDFKMLFFNPDGTESLCGNGSRCAVAFANRLKIINMDTNFVTTDGAHHAIIKGDTIYFQLKDLNEVILHRDSYFINNGSPHYIKFLDDISQIDVLSEGSKIRNSSKYQPSGTNVNFAQIRKDKLIVRTFERGVEDETLSCGTGVVASAIASSFRGLKSPISIETLGGKLSVSFVKTADDKFKDIYLAGPALKVFEGQIDIDSFRKT